MNLFLTFIKNKGFTGKSYPKLKILKVVCMKGRTK